MVWCDAFLCRICRYRICLVVAVDQNASGRHPGTAVCIGQGLYIRADSAEQRPMVCRGQSKFKSRPATTPLAAIIRAEACVWAVLPPPCCLSAPVQPLRHHRRLQQ